MNLLCKVDQAAALRAGINAPSSTVMLDVDPATLTPWERDIIGAMLQDGHDLTRPSPAQVFEGRTLPPLQVVLVSPTIIGLRHALARIRGALLEGDWGTRKYTRIVLPHDVWEFSDGSPTRLRSTLDINGTCHHLLAIQVILQDGHMQAAVDPADEADLDLLRQADGANEPYETTEINGFNYVVFMSPFCT